jgi:hypothetical protein
MESVSAGDAAASPEAAQEATATENSEQAEAKPKTTRTRRLTAGIAPRTPRRRPAAKKSE